MSDTLQEREDQMSTERTDQIESKNADWCDDCHGYVHAPWCPAYEQTVPCQRCEGIATTTVNTRHFGLEKLCEPCAVNVRRDGQEVVVSEHQPAARGGGDGDKWSIKVHGNEIDADLLVNGSYAGTLHADKAKQVLAEHNQHQSLVVERERLLKVLKLVTASYVRPDDEGVAAQAAREAIATSEQRSTSE